MLTGGEERMQTEGKGKGSGSAEMSLEPWAQWGRAWVCNSCCVPWRERRRLWGPGEIL